MLKYSGILLIFISCLMAGVFKVLRLTKHISVLQSTVNMLSTFKIEINYSQPLLSDLFCTYSDDIINDFIFLLSASIKECDSPKICISECVEGSQSLSVLSENEKEVLKELLSSLGTTDISAQDLLLTRGIKRVEEFLLSAKEQKNKNSKVYLTFSIYIGLAAAVLLL